MIQAEARQNGLRYDSKYESLEQRDREIANSAAFRKSLYDYDVEEAAIACRDHGEDLPARTALSAHVGHR